MASKQFACGSSFQKGQPGQAPYVEIQVRLTVKRVNFLCELRGICHCMSWGPAVCGFHPLSGIRPYCCINCSALLCVLCTFQGDVEEAVSAFLMKNFDIPEDKIVFLAEK